MDAPIPLSCVNTRPNSHNRPRPQVYRCSLDSTGSRSRCDRNGSYLSAVSNTRVKRFSRSGLIAVPHGQIQRWRAFSTSWEPSYSRPVAARSCSRGSFGLNCRDALVRSSTRRYAGPCSRFTCPDSPTLIGLTLPLHANAPTYPYPDRFPARAPGASPPRLSPARGSFPSPCRALYRLPSVNPAPLVRRLQARRFVPR